MNESAKDNATEATNVSSSDAEMAKSFGSDTPKAKAVKGAADKTDKAAGKDGAAKSDSETPSDAASAAKVLDKAGGEKAVDVNSALKTELAVANDPQHKGK